MLKLMKYASIIALISLAACQDRTPQRSPAQVVHVDSSGGEVSQFSLMQNAVGWLTDSNIVSLASVVNQSAVNLARAESQAWTDEPTHQYALMILRDHAAFQSSLDSLAAKHRLPAQSPAVATEFHARYDSVASGLSGLPASEVDPKFLSLVNALHAKTLVDFGALAGNAIDPDLKALLTIRAETMEQQHITRATALAASIVAADSAKLAAKADSAQQRKARKP